MAAVTDGKMKRSKKKDADEFKFLVTNGGLVLILKGRRIVEGQANLAVLAALHEQEGFVVSYSSLCKVIGHRTARGKQLHILRQYIGSLKRLLVTHKLSFVIAV